MAGWNQPNGVFLVVNKETWRAPGAACTISFLFWLGTAIFIFPQASVDAAVSSTRLHRAIGARAFTVAQDDNGTDEGEVPPEQVDKYVAVYRAMNRDRGLSVEQAAAAQGMTLQGFRELENRVQRDDSALQHVRDELQAAAKGKAGIPSDAAGTTGQSIPPK